MESLDNTEWDVVIAGTGLRQSLLALSLSRSDKKILHIDRNEYYGGPDAAFSLQEAEEWAKNHSDAGRDGTFTNASISKDEGTTEEKLSFSRAYSLALSPQLIYARSAFLPNLVSSKVYRQLEFVAMGSWWVYSPSQGNDTEGTASDVTDAPTNGNGRLSKIPSSREDIFADTDLPPKAKRGLMKFVRFITEYEEQPKVWESYKDRPFSEFAAEAFKLPVELNSILLALTLTPTSPQQTTTEYALPRIARHLRSIGVFGPGFGAVIPKWGGLAEITQVACRSCAVGGAWYALGNGLKSQEETADGTQDDKGDGKDDSSESPKPLKLGLSEGDKVSSKFLAGCVEDLSSSPEPSAQQQSSMTTTSRSIAIVSSPLGKLFPQLAEGAPLPTGAVVVFPTGSLKPDTPPVYIIVHSSDTGGCPAGQSVLYINVALPGDDGSQLISQALHSLLEAINPETPPRVLWSMNYQEEGEQPLASAPARQPSVSDSGNVLTFPPPSLDLALDDVVLNEVKAVWQKIVGEDARGFMDFEDREQYDDDE